MLFGYPDIALFHFNSIIILILIWWIPNLLYIELHKLWQPNLLESPDFGLGFTCQRPSQESMWASPNSSHKQPKLFSWQWAELHKWVCWLILKVYTTQNDWYFYGLFQNRLFQNIKCELRLGVLSRSENWKNLLVFVYFISFRARGKSRLSVLRGLRMRDLCYETAISCKYGIYQLSM